MKNVLNRIFAFSLISTMMLSIFTDVNSIEIDKDNKSLKIYGIKEKEEVLVENNEIINFYEEFHEELDILIEEKELKEKEERISYKKQIVEFALKFVGNPYVMGGNSLTSGTDCSGFTMLIYANFGVSIPRTTTGQQLSGVEVSIDDIEPGDIISYGYGESSTHSALYIGNDMVVHASIPELGIRIDNMYMMPILSIRRVI